MTFPDYFSPFGEEDPPVIDFTSFEDEDNPFFEDDFLSLNNDVNNENEIQTPNQPSCKVQLPSGPATFQNRLQSNIHFVELPNNISIFPPNPLFFNSSYEEFEKIQNAKQIEDQSFRDAPKRTPKRKVDLSEDALHYKNEFYSVFVKKKKFEKKFVKLIHNEFISKEFVLKPMTREEGRRIDLYFQNYAMYAKKIIPFLRAKRNEISKFLKSK